MKKSTFLFRLVVLLATMMCALGASAQEAYACYTSENTTLTFYYDNQRSSRPGTTYNLNTGAGIPAWYYDYTNANVTKVVFDSSFDNASPTTTSHWFMGMRRLESITGLNYLRTFSVTDMSYMFAYCSSLTSLDLRAIYTYNVTDMRNMF